MCSTVEWHVVSTGCLTALKSWFQILCGVCMFSHMSVCVLPQYTGFLPQFKDVELVGLG